MTRIILTILVALAMSLSFGCASGRYKAGTDSARTKLITDLQLCQTRTYWEARLAAYERVDTAPKRVRAYPRSRSSQGRPTEGLAAATARTSLKTIEAEFKARGGVECT